MLGYVLSFFGVRLRRYSTMFGTSMFYFSNFDVWLFRCLGIILVSCLSLRDHKCSMIRKTVKNDMFIAI